MKELLILLVDALIAQGIIPSAKRAALVAAINDAFDARYPPQGP